ncbi:glycosyltransferase family 9 protein [Candidatus Electronema sp. PJ]|uniref:glycosyltransferase family 9 protein n=1 Tax=Candidatus Electronema sp. PJ TaxID=3401572 RepID=UPI003AA94A8D
MFSSSLRTADRESLALGCEIAPLKMPLETSRILIVKPSSLGDIVHTLPVVHALKRSLPGCFIGWIVQQAFAPLLAADQNIDAIYPIQIPSTSEPQAGRWAWLAAGKATLQTLQTLRKQFRQAPYDLILDLHASFRSGLLGWTNPGGMRIGFRDAKELNTLFQDQLVAVPAEVQHAQEKNLLFCKQLGINVAAEDFHLPCREEDREAAQIFLAEQGARGKQIIYANPAARWQTKFWPVERWAELADHFAAQGRLLVFGGSKQDVNYIAAITRLMRSQPVIAAGRLNLAQSAALISRSALYVGLDSGPMHIAALAKVPVVALFGPTHPERVGPWSVASRIIRAEGLHCLECRQRSCAHLACMKGISVQMVSDAAAALLES